MDRTTFEIERKQIRNTIAAIIGIIVLAAVVSSVILYMVNGNFIIKENERAFEVLTYLVVAFTVFLLSLTITYWLGLTINYTDWFRVRRGYSYWIRKRSILIYTPILALFACLAKTGAVYSELTDGSQGIFKILIFYVLIFILYSLCIASAVMLLTGLSKLGYILIFALLPWIFTYLATINKIPLYFRMKDMGIIGVSCVVAGIIFVAALANMKRVYNRRDYR